MNKENEIIDKKETKKVKKELKAETEAKENKVKKRTALKVILILLIIILILFITAIIVYKIYNNKQKENVSARIAELENVFIGSNKEIEYGTEIQIDALEKELLDLERIQESDTYVLQINNDEQMHDNTYKFLQIGDNKIKCIITEEDPNKKVLYINTDLSNLLNFFNNFYIKYEPVKIEIEKEYDYKVVDTQMPIIEGVQDKEIIQGNDIDLTSGISAKDAIDGELEFSIEGEVKKDVVGEYPIKVKAVDKNSNETIVEFKVTVKEKKVVTAPTVANNKISSSNKSANKKTNTSTNIATYTPLPALETEMFNKTNQYRTSAGLKPLTWDSTLASIARDRSIATARLGAAYYGWGHFGTEYSDIFSHLKSRGVSFTDANEVIAWNYSTSAAVKWLYNSPLHKAAMMGNYDKTGCGVCKGPDGEYLYFQVFVKK